MDAKDAELRSLRQRLRDAETFIDRELEEIAHPDFTSGIGESLLRDGDAQKVGNAYSDNLAERLREIKLILVGTVDAGTTGRLGDFSPAMAGSIPGEMLDKLEASLCNPVITPHAEREAELLDNLERVRILRGCFDALTSGKQEHTVMCIPFRDALRAVRDTVEQYRRDTLEAHEDLGFSVVTSASVDAVNVHTGKVFKIVNEAIGDGLPPIVGREAAKEFYPRPYMPTGVHNALVAADAGLRYLWNGLTKPGGATLYERDFAREALLAVQRELRLEAKAEGRDYPDNELAEIERAVAGTRPLRDVAAALYAIQTLHGSSADKGGAEEMKTLRRLSRFIRTLADKLDGLPPPHIVTNTPGVIIYQSGETIYVINPRYPLPEGAPPPQGVNPIGGYIFPATASREEQAAEIVNELHKGIKGGYFPEQTPEALRRLDILRAIIVELADDYKHAQVRERRYEERLEHILAWVWRRLHNGVRNTPSDLPTVLRFILRLANGQERLVSAPTGAEVSAALEGKLDPLPSDFAPMDERAAVAEAVGTTRRIANNALGSVERYLLARPTFYAGAEELAAREGLAWLRTYFNRPEGAPLESGEYKDADRLEAELEEAQEAARTSQLMASLENRRAEEVIKENNTLRRKANALKPAANVCRKLETILEGSEPKALEIFYGRVGYAELLELLSSLKCVLNEADKSKEIKPLRFDLTEPERLIRPGRGGCPPYPHKHNPDGSTSHLVAGVDKAYVAGADVAEGAKPEVSIFGFPVVLSDELKTEEIRFGDFGTMPPDVIRREIVDNPNADKVHGLVAALRWLETMEKYVKQSPFDFANSGYVSPLEVLRGVVYLREYMEARSGDYRKLRALYVAEYTRVQSLEVSNRAYLESTRDLNAKMVALVAAHAENVSRLTGDKAIVEAGLLLVLGVNKRLREVVRTFARGSMSIVKAVGMVEDGSINLARIDYTPLSPLDTAARMLGEIKAIAQTLAQTGEEELAIAEDNTPNVRIEARAGVGSPRTQDEEGYAGFGPEDTPLG